MKKLFVILIVLLFASTAWGMVGGITNPVEKEDSGGECPVTKVKGKIAACLTCHTLKTNGQTVSWGLKEVDLFAEYDTPYGTSFKLVDDKVVGWYNFSDVNASRVREILEYYYNRRVAKMVINVDSFGGSAFDGNAIVSLFESYIGRMIIETRVESYALSAGLLVFAAGHDGHRYVSPMATLMWHEIAYVAFLRKVTPASSEQDAIIMRGFQNVANEYLAKRSEKTKEEIDAKVLHLDWWFNGMEALEMGFADKLLK